MSHRVTLAWVALAVMGMTILTGCSAQPVAQDPGTKPPSESAQNPVLAAAERALDSGDAQSAASQLLGAIGAKPADGQMWEVFAKALLQLRAYPAASESAERSLQLQPGRSLAHLWAGMAQADLGLYDSAIAHLKETAATGKEPALTARALGVAYLGADKRAEAIETLKAAVARYPSDKALGKAYTAAQGDLDGDGIPEQIEVSPTAVAVRGGKNGAEYLRLTNQQGGNFKAYSFDAGGELPVLIVTTYPNGTQVFHFQGGQLKEIGKWRGFVNLHWALQSFEVVSPTPVNGTLPAGEYQEQAGTLVRASEPAGVVDGKPAPIVDSLGLLIAVASRTGNYFGSTQVMQEWGKHRAQTDAKPQVDLILPLPDGSYQVELTHDHKVVARGVAHVSQKDGTLKITDVAWQ